MRGEMELEVSADEISRSLISICYGGCLYRDFLLYRDLSSKDVKMALSCASGQSICGPFPFTSCKQTVF